MNENNHQCIKKMENVYFKLRTHYWHNLANDHYLMSMTSEESFACKASFHHFLNLIL
jgi:hypothetical protein